MLYSVIYTKAAAAASQLEHLEHSQRRRQSTSSRMQRFLITAQTPESSL